MKKIVYIAYIVLSLIALASCTNLDEQIYSKLAKDNFFTSEENFARYSARAYASLQHWATEKSYWTFDMQISDEVCVPLNPAGAWDDNGRYKQVQIHDIPEANRLLECAWDYCFNGITACNDVLDIFTSVDKDFDGKARSIAEMKVLRAYFYFCAICYWAEVPYAPKKDIKNYPEKKDRTFIFNWIEKEIKDNIDYLAENPTTEYYGRVTRGVADFLLAKLYLNSEKLTGTARWAEAEDACRDIMTRNNGISYYTLADNYKDLFKVDNEFNPEGILAIPYSTVYTTSDHYAFIIYMSTLPADLCDPMGIAAKAWDGLVAEPDFMASYEAGDTRKADTWIFGQQYDLDGNKLSIEVDGVNVDYVINPIFPESRYEGRRTALEGARIGKWTYQNDRTLTGGQVGMNNDFYLMRYADVVLMYLEAVVRQGKTSADAAAMTALTKIRTRAGLGALTFGELTLEKIYQERSHELAIEGWHRQDMIRFDKYLEAWWFKPAKDASDYNLPIPTSAVSANPNLK